jgi:hypothetical protein
MVESSTPRMEKKRTWRRTVPRSVLALLRPSKLCDEFLQILHFFIVPNFPKDCERATVADERVGVAARPCLHGPETL